MIYTVKTLKTCFCHVVIYNTIENSMAFVSVLAKIVVENLKLHEQNILLNGKVLVVNRNEN